MLVAYEIQIDIFAGILECQCLMYVSDGYSILFNITDGVIFGIH